MSVRCVLTRAIAIAALSSAVACAVDTPTAPRPQPSAKPAADLCSGYSLTNGKC
jgi:hypothetical protein